MKRKAHGGQQGSHAKQHQQQRPGPAGPSPAVAATLHPPRSTGPMGWGSAFEDENTDVVLDEMDRLTPRDLAVARFRRNHEYMEGIFDERKIANLEPGPSPYSQLSRAELQAQLDTTLETTEQAKAVFEERVSLFRRNISAEQLEREEEEEALQDSILDQQSQGWTRKVGKGKIVSVDVRYVRAKTPDFLVASRRKEQGEKEAQNIAAPPASSFSDPQTSLQPSGLPSHSIQMQTQDGDADEDVDAEAEGEDDSDEDVDESDGDGDDDDDEDEEGEGDEDEDDDDDAEDEGEGGEDFEGAHDDDGDGDGPDEILDAAGEQKRAEEREAIFALNDAHGMEPLPEAFVEPKTEPLPPVTSTQAEAASSSSAGPPQTDVGAAMDSTSQQQDTEMVDIIQNGSENSGLASLDRQTPAEPATLGSEAESLTHPLSAEAQAAAVESDAPVNGEGADVAIETADPVATSIEPATAADSVSAGVEGVPTEMKAPTPPLTENLADNDAPKELKTDAEAAQASDD